MGHMAAGVITLAGEEGGGSNESCRPLTPVFTRRHFRPQLPNDPTVSLIDLPLCFNHTIGDHRNTRASLDVAQNHQAERKGILLETR